MYKKKKKRDSVQLDTEQYSSATFNYGLHIFDIRIIFLKCP